MSVCNEIQVDSPAVCVNCHNSKSLTGTVCDKDTNLSLEGPLLTIIVLDSKQTFHLVFIYESKYLYQSLLPDLFSMHK